MSEAPAWVAENTCYWFVDDPLQGRRPCANWIRSYFGERDFGVCATHERKLLAIIMSNIHLDAGFRRDLVREINDCDLGEVNIWAENGRDISNWPSNPRARAHCVYFVERDGFVKIGRASNLNKRIRDIGKGSCMPQGMSVGPVRLLATVYCDCDAGRCVREKYFHGRFDETRLEGEWFLFDAELAGFIGGLEGCLDDGLREVSSPSIHGPR